VQALKEIPAVNAEIDGTDIIYKNYYHIGVAVGTDKGLVVPVVRDATSCRSPRSRRRSPPRQAARDGSSSIDDMQGGTFTISNGGVYGSLMSTPILNAPQSGILGMHKIQERPVVVGGQIVIRPMMYLALSYDHRIVDGKEAVTFLVRVKESLEDPRPERLVSRSLRPGGRAGGGGWCEDCDGARRHVLGRTLRQDSGSVRSCLGVQCALGQCITGRAVGE
jgi:2-oxoglutarate dehydrogenase E2 component (dihydrolipoamide succinyltransferase)